VTSFPLLEDGRVGPCATVLNQTGPLGPNKARQDAPHPHSVTMSADGRVAFVADLGVDRVFAYDVTSENGTIAPHQPAFATFAAGTGPRHSKFSPDGKSFYVLDELDATITACRYDASGAVVEPFQRVESLPADFNGKNTASEIRIHPNGRFVYSANRGHDSIAVFARNPDSGALTRIEVVKTGGQTPRNFNLTPDGAWLLCAHQSSNTLTVFKVDAETGKLTANPATAKVPKCVCVLFVN
jgi:6-phosphogluconolactonase